MLLQIATISLLVFIDGTRVFIVIGLCALRESNLNGLISFYLLGRVMLIGLDFVKVLDNLFLFIIIFFLTQ